MTWVGEASGRRGRANWTQDGEEINVYVCVYKLYF